MNKVIAGLGRLHGAGKWLLVGLTTLGGLIGLLVNARSLGLTPWLAVGSMSLANLAARRVVLAPAHDTAFALGDTLQLAATVTDAHGSVIGGATVAWASDDSTVATVDSSGAVLARGPGTTTISANVHEHVGVAHVTVYQRVRSVAIARDTLVRLPEGGTVQLLARALDARGHVVAGRLVRWTSGDSSVVAITAAGAATAGSPGHTTLVASLEDRSASVPAEVVLAPSSVRLLSGDAQRAPAGRRLPQSVAVQVLSRGGRPVPGATVVFAPQDAQGKADPESATTDREGRARITWTLGPLPGRQHLGATASGLDTTVVTTAEADPIAAATRVQALGDAPQGPAGAALGAPVGIRVTDSSGAALADVPVEWTALDGGTIEGLAPRTDSLGQAFARWSLSRRAGTQRARAQVGNPRTMPPFTLTATALAGPAAAVVVESGDDQQGAVGAELRHAVVARLTDSAGNAVAGASVRLLATSGSVPDSMATSDERGRVSARWTLGRQAGDQALELRLGRLPPVRVRAKALPLEPANLEPVGAPRSGLAGRALPRPVAFVVTDAYGNAIPDVAVAFTAGAGRVSPTRVMTDAKGRAATRWTLGGEMGDQTLTAAVRHTSVRGAMTVRAVRRSAGR